MSFEQLTGGNVEPRGLEEEMRSAYLDYAMSVIVGRALPDVRDGLKPVHRRVLYAMQQAGLAPNRPYRKSATTVGEVMAKYHPHGDSAIYDTLVRLAQDFAMRHPLVDGQGNFGSIDADPPAAMRYCVVGDTRVRTAEGSPRIADLVPDAQPESDNDVDVEVLDRQSSAVRASKLFHSGDHPTLRLNTAEGYELTGTENHPVLCLVDMVGVPLLMWKLLEEIEPGDRVLIARQPHGEVSEVSEQERRLAILAGAFVAEGFVSERRAGFNNIDSEYFDEVLAAYDAVVGGPRYVYSREIASGSTLHELDVQNLGHWRDSAMVEVAGASREKRVPEFVWRAAAGTKRAFLQSLFTGDGSSSLLPRSTIQVSYSTYSEQLARDVQQLLLEFGVVSRLCRYEKGEVKVVITNRRDARLFCANVGFLGAKQEKLQRDLATIPVSSRALSRDHVPFVADYIRQDCGSRWVDKDWLRRHNVDRIERWEQGGTAILERIESEEVRKVVEPLVSGEYFYAEVESVEPAGVQPVYSVKVETDDHSFLTDGFVSHNTEARLARLATEMLRDLDRDTVDFGPNYDDSTLEPLVLPARFPNLLVNGTTGIAVGMATNIPPHNLGESIDAVCAFIDDPEIDVAGLMRHIKAPDFPTGGIIRGLDGVRDAYETGRGRVVLEGKVHVEELKGGKKAIIVDEMPFQVTKFSTDPASLVMKIKEGVEKGRLTEVANIEDESSNRGGIRLVVELKRGANHQIALNKLYKHTPLRTSFGVNAVALVDGVPRTLGLVPIIRNYVDHQRDVVVRRTKHELREKEARLHILEGLLTALDQLDAVIALIRAAANPDEAREGLMSEFGLSEVQSQAILDMRLQRLTALEADKIRAEHADTLEVIAELRELLGSESMVMDLIKTELLEVKERYADERRTAITYADGDISVEDMIEDKQMVIAITKSGYIKSLPLATYRSQHRGGVGVTGMDMKDEDYIEHLFVTSAHDYLLFFTNRGKVYRQKVYELPEASRTAKGRALVNVLPLREGEFVRAVLATRDFTEGKYLVFATRKGQIKKTEFLAYNTPIKADGIIAIKIRDDDELVAVRRTSGDDDIIMVSHSGQAARFSEDDARPMGRDTAGVKGMNVSRGDNHVLAMDVVQPDTQLLVVTENGYGKRTPIEEYPVKGRGAMGVRTIGLTEKKGGVAGALIVREHQDLVFISQSGMVQRTGVRGISQQGRPAQGVRVMNLREEDVVSAVALVMDDEADTSTVADGEPEGLQPLDGAAEAGGPDDEAVPDEPDRAAD